jgi:hypothetical protein
MINKTIIITTTTTITTMIKMTLLQMLKLSGNSLLLHLCRSSSFLLNFPGAFSQIVSQ